MIAGHAIVGRDGMGRDDRAERRRRCGDRASAPPRPHVRGIHRTCAGGHRDVRPRHALSRRERPLARRLQSGRDAARAQPLRHLSRDRRRVDGRSSALPGGGRGKRGGRSFCARRRLPAMGQVAGSALARRRGRDRRDHHHLGGHFRAQAGPRRAAAREGRGAARLGRGAAREGGGFAGARRQSAGTRDLPFFPRARRDAALSLFQRRRGSDQRRRAGGDSRRRQRCLWPNSAGAPPPAAEGGRAQRPRADGFFPRGPVPSPQRLADALAAVSLAAATARGRNRGLERRLRRHHPGALRRV